ncbi:hypothetical protein HK096_000414, partial [Nowakowskiella sp. JEL0078]
MFLPSPSIDTEALNYRMSAEHDSSPSIENTSWATRQYMLQQKQYRIKQSQIIDRSRTTSLNRQLENTPKTEIRPQSDFQRRKTMASILPDFQPEFQRRSTMASILPDSHSLSFKNHLQLNENHQTPLSENYRFSSFPRRLSVSSSSDGSRDDLSDLENLGLHFRERRLASTTTSFEKPRNSPYQENFETSPSLNRGRRASRLTQPSQHSVQKIPQSYREQPIQSDQTYHESSRVSPINRQSAHHEHVHNLQSQYQQVYRESTRNSLSQSQPIYREAVRVNSSPVQFQKNYSESTRNSPSQSQPIYREAVRVNSSPVQFQKNYSDQVRNSPTQRQPMYREPVRGSPTHRQPTLREPVHESPTYQELRSSPTYHKSTVRKSPNSSIENLPNSGSQMYTPPRRTSSLGIASFSHSPSGKTTTTSNSRLTSVPQSPTQTPATSILNSVGSALVSFFYLAPAADIAAAEAQLKLQQIKGISPIAESPKPTAKTTNTPTSFSFQSLFFSPTQTNTHISITDNEFASVLPPLKTIPRKFLVPPESRPNSGYLTPIQHAPSPSPYPKTQSYSNSSFPIRKSSFSSSPTPNPNPSFSSYSTPLPPQSFSTSPTSTPKPIVTIAPIPQISIFSPVTPQISTPLTSPKLSQQTFSPSQLTQSTDIETERLIIQSTPILETTAPVPESQKQKKQSKKTKKKNDLSIAEFYGADFSLQSALNESPLEYSSNHQPTEDEIRRASIAIGLPLRTAISIVSSAISDSMQNGELQDEADVEKQGTVFIAALNNIADKRNNLEETRNENSQSPSIESHPINQGMRFGLPGIDASKMFSKAIKRKPGIEVFRIENFKPVPVPDKMFGIFSLGDCYIILLSKWSSKIGKNSNDGGQNAVDEGWVKIVAGDPVPIRIIGHKLSKSRNTQKKIQVHRDDIEDITHSSTNRALGENHDDNLSSTPTSDTHHSAQGTPHLQEEKIKSEFLFDNTIPTDILSDSLSDDDTSKNDNVTKDEVDLSDDELSLEESDSEYCDSDEEDFDDLASYASSAGSRTLAHQLFTWIGPSAELDKRFCSAMFAVALRNYLGSSIRIERTAANEESLAFRNLFALFQPAPGEEQIELSEFNTKGPGDNSKQFLALRYANVDSAAESSLSVQENDSDDYDDEISPRKTEKRSVKFYKVEKGTNLRDIKLRLCEPSSKSLDSKTVCIIDTSKEIYQWNGALAGQNLRSKCRILVSKMVGGGTKKGLKIT